MAVALGPVHLPTACKILTDSSGMEPSGLGPIIQKIVAAAVRASDQVVDDGLGGFPVVVGLVISPTVIEGHAGLPGASLRRGLDMLLGRREIPGQAVAIVDDDVWLEFEYHLVHLFRFPLCRRERPIDVVP